MKEMVEKLTDMWPSREKRSNLNTALKKKALKTILSFYQNNDYYVTGIVLGTGV